MDVKTKIQDLWRKNAPELVGLFNGSLPKFVTASAPKTVGGGVPAFCYHIVNEANFRKDLTFLKENGYRTLSGPEFLAHLEGRSPADERSVLLTFDDGARNFYDVAFPLLREFSAKAIHFIAPGLHADQSIDADLADTPMDWQQLQEIHQSGLVEFQSHTLESRYVPRWPEPAALAGCAPAVEEARRLRKALDFAEDIDKSRTLLEQQFPGMVANHLSFPMYLGTADAVAIAKTKGFQACYWGYIPNRPLNPAGASALYISRISDEFVRRLPGKKRISFREIFAERLRRARAGKEWRRRFASAAAQ